MQIIALTAFVFMAVSCKRAETPLIPEEQGKEKAPRNDKNLMVSVQNENGILVFQDSLHVRNILENLDASVEAHNLSFVNANSHLNEEQLNELEESSNFDDEVPVTNFENSLSFVSLRKLVKDAEDAWLENEGENIANDPDNHFITDETVRGVLNQYNEVKIGSSYYKFVEDGYYEVMNNDRSTLLQMRHDSIDVSTLPNVKSYRNSNLKSQHIECESNKRNADYKTSGSRRIKWVVSHSTYPWGWFVKAKTKNYQRNNRGKWKKYRAYCEAQVYGKVSQNANCTLDIVFNTKGSFNKKTGNEKKVKHKIPVSTRIRKEWVKSYHDGAGGITHDKNLTW